MDALVDTVPETIKDGILLNLGCGRTPLERLADPWPWQEVRVDADPESNPDVVADMRDLPFPDDYADGIVCLGALEHIEEPSLPLVLGEMNRVLRPGGGLRLLVPDLRAVAQVILDGRLMDPLVDSPAGPVRALDILYGFAPMLAEHPLWGHRMGFTAESLADWLTRAGFEGKVGTSSAAPYMLVADATKRLNTDEGEAHA